MISASALTNPKYIYGGIPNAILKRPKVFPHNDERGVNIIRVKNLDTKFGGCDKYQSQLNYAMKCFGSFEYKDLKVLSRG
jgi:hypothetical protein